MTRVRFPSPLQKPKDKALFLQGFFVSDASAVVTSIEKTQAILGALRTHLITDLFLDQELAQSVLRELT